MPPYPRVEKAIPILWAQKTDLENFTLVRVFNDGMAWAHVIDHVRGRRGKKTISDQKTLPDNLTNMGGSGELG